MEVYMRKIDEKERNELIKEVKKSLAEGKGASCAFRRHAEKYKRAAGSVRNFYYKTIAGCRKDKKLQLRLKISDEMFPAFIEEFSKNQEKELVKSVLEGISEGKSVRKTISELAGGNDKLALRYQNKYRNILKDNPALVFKTKEELESGGGKYKNPYDAKRAAKKLDFKELQEGINGMIERLSSDLKRENADLKDENAKLKCENDKLRNALKKILNDKSVEKGYFITEAR